MHKRTKKTNLDPLLLVLGEHALLDHLGLYRNASQPFEPEPHIAIEFVLGLVFFFMPVSHVSPTSHDLQKNKNAPWPASRPEQIQSVLPIRYHDLGKTVNNGPQTGNLKGLQ